MSAAQAPALDMDKLNAFIGQFVTDLGASVHAGMVVIGEKLGLYKALAIGPMTPAELAAKTGTDARYLREWLASQAAGGYITYNEASNTFSLTQEQAFTLAHEDSPAYLPGAFELALGSLAAVPRIAESFRTGAGMGWHEHDDGVFHGCEKFFRPGYAANLVSSWIPALDDVKQKLEAGARVADVGCGKGASTLLMAKAFPRSRFFGFDYHDKSIEAARESAQREGIADRITFEVSKAKEFPGQDDRGAVRERSVEGQSESRGARLLLLLHPAVYTMLAVAGGGAVSGCAGRRKTDSGSREFSRLQPLPPRDRDTFQHRIRGTAVRRAYGWAAVRPSARCPVVDDNGDRRMQWQKL